MVELNKKTQAGVVAYNSIHIWVGHWERGEKDWGKITEIAKDIGKMSSNSLQEPILISPDNGIKGRALPYESFSSIIFNMPHPNYWTSSDIAYFYFYLTHGITYESITKLLVKKLQGELAFSPKSMMEYEQK